MHEFHVLLTNAALQWKEPAVFRTPFVSSETLQGSALPIRSQFAEAQPHSKVRRVRSRLLVAVSQCETVSEEAATPGHPTLSRLGTARQLIP